MSYSINSDLSFKDIGGELFIYNRKNSTIYSFNGTGVFIWNGLRENVPVDHIACRLCEEYDVTAAEAQTDVSEFVKKISDNGLVSFAME